MKLMPPHGGETPSPRAGSGAGALPTPSVLSSFKILPNFYFEPDCLAGAAAAAAMARLQPVHFILSLWRKVEWTERSGSGFFVARCVVNDGWLAGCRFSQSWAACLGFESWRWPAAFTRGVEWRATRGRSGGCGSPQALPACTHFTPRGTPRRPTRQWHRQATPASP